MRKKDSVKVKRGQVLTLERSCGAIVFRDGEAGESVLMVQHGPGHWSFPKGHVEAGEQDRQTAIREVFEETGIRIEIKSDFQGSSSYSPRPGVLKTVIFFLGDYLGGRLTPQLTEVRAAAWMPLDEADRLLVFDRDRQIFHQALEYRRQRAAS